MIGLLYESGEWSDYKLAAELCEAGCEVRMIDMAHLSERAACAAARGCGLLVSRVFASAVFRGHAQAHETMAAVCDLAERAGIPMINSPRAHSFEIDKSRAAGALAETGIEVPHIQECGAQDELVRRCEAGALSYPCIIKPNCGGRTTYTAIARSAEDALRFLSTAPNIELIVQDYIEPERGFITRIELVDGECALIVKRGVVDGLSAYHLGSRYALYPECPQEVRDAALRAGRALDISFGSFDIIEAGGHAWLIDANAVSNVSPDNTEMFGLDLMRAYAQAIALRRV